MFFFKLLGLSVFPHDIAEGDLKVRLEQSEILGQSFIVVHYTLIDPAPVDFQIVDLNGRIHKQITRDTWSGKMQNRKTINIEGLSSGMYILNLSDGKNNASVKFIIKK